ncbi:cytochrome c oxidase assembly protein [Cesiribacter sp. SM1]|uniref:cytochrome c oxidase assembly protein n=1 Tax=Cesiribacter sp. SM1 TaxID=2861196 RepID=UPI001CD27840|nr:cytochrome c oxidase assembly protein [Cesiribacter sp. SM1]
MQEHYSAYNSPSFWIPNAILLLVLLLYLMAVVRQYQQGKSWSGWRTAGFCSGIALLILALWPPLMHYGHQNLEGHMIQHLLIGMLAPLGLVLAAPLTLVLRTLNPPTGRRLTAVLGSRPFHYVSHPLTALLLNIGGMYLLYLTPLYGAIQHHPYLHWVLHLHFLLAGYLFVWAIAGPDPAPRRPGLQLRSIVLFISAGAHAYLSKAMYAYEFPRNTHHSLEEIQAAAKLMYYGGDLAELLLAVAFFYTWYKAKERRSKTIQTAGVSVPQIFTGYTAK